MTVAALVLGCAPPAPTPSVFPTPSVGAPLGPPLSAADPCPEDAGEPDPVVDLDLDSGLAPLAIAGGADHLWVTVTGSPAGEVFGIDPTSRSVTGGVNVGWAPTYIAVDGDRIWVSETVGDGSHDPNDPHQNAVTAIDSSGSADTWKEGVARPGQIVVGNTFIWVTSNGTELQRLDPASAVVVGEPIEMNGDIVHLRSNGTLIFATTLGSAAAVGSLTVLDEASGEVQQKVPIASPMGPALSSGPQTWVPVHNEDGWVLRELTGAALRGSTPLPDGTDVNSFASGGGDAVWAWTTSGCVYSFDLSSSTLVGRSWVLDASRGDAIGISASGQDAWLLDTKGVVRVRR